MDGRGRWPMADGERSARSAGAGPRTAGWLAGGDERNAHSEGDTRADVVIGRDYRSADVKIFAPGRLSVEPDFRAA